MAAFKSPRVASLLELDVPECESEEVLEIIQDQGVRRLKSLTCMHWLEEEDSFNSEWAADVLRAASPLLEELELIEPAEEHLHIAHSMPRLRRLFVEGYEPGSGTDAAYVRELPARQNASHLETLSLDTWHGIPPLPLLQALLRAHGGSIKTLQVYSSGHYRTEFRAAWLGQCGLTALRRLCISEKFLQGPWGWNEARIQSAMMALNQSLPNAEVVVLTGYNHDIF